MEFLELLGFSLGGGGGALPNCLFLFFFTFSADHKMYKKCFFRVDFCLCLKKNQNAPGPSEHPPVGVPVW